MLVVVLNGLALVTMAQELLDDPAVRHFYEQKQGVKILKGQIKTLEAAIDEEGNVDWYVWYLACRQYLMETGGFRCPAGTAVYFYRSGQLDTDSQDPFCQASVRGKFYPMPEKTALEVLILPVRRQHDLPATRQEILRRTQSLGEP